MHTLSSHDMNRARPLLRQFNLLLLALFAGLIVGRSLPAVDNALTLSTQISAEEDVAEAERKPHPRPRPEKIDVQGGRN